MVALPVLVSGLEAEMIRLGYKDSTMVWYHGAWRRLQRYFSARGVEEFSLDVAMEWVDEACGGFFAKEQAGTLKQTDVYLFRVAQMLGDYEAPRRRAAPLLPHGQQAVRATRPLSSPGSGHGCGPRSGAPRRCGLTGRRPGSSPRSRARAAGWPAATPGWSGRLSPRWPATRPRPSSRSCARLRSFLRFASGDGPGRHRHGGGGPGGAVPQAGPGPVGLGPGRRGQDPGRGRPGQPVREARLRDHLAGGPARAAQHRRQAAGVRRFRLAGLPAVRRPGQDRQQDLAAAAEGRRLGGHRLRPQRPAGQRLPAGVPAAHRPGRPVLRPGPPAPDPGQVRPGGSRPGERGDAATACTRCGTRWRPA